MPGRRWDDGQGPWWDTHDPANVWDAKDTPAMNDDKRNYNFADEILYSESRLIIAACGTYPAVAARLPANFVSETDALRTSALDASAGTGNNAAELAGLTDDQNTALKEADRLGSLARDIAGKAPQFKANETLLRDQFRVGDNRKTIPGRIDRALKIHAACVDADNAPTMAARGWKAADSAALEAAILGATGADTIQEARKATNKGDTRGLIGLNNDLLDRIYTMQGAARLEYRDGSAASATALETFRDGIFPPVQNKNAPTIPRKLIARALETGSLKIFVDYNIANRATDYVITARNKATGEVILTRETADNKATLDFTGAAPAGTEVEITVTARNDSGLSKPAGPVTAVVP